MTQRLDQLLQSCTVKLTIPGQIGWGTGFFVAPGLILTCAHVVKQAGDQPILLHWQNQENWAEAGVEQLLSEPYDLALLRFTLPQDADPPCVYLDEEIRSRDPLYLFGYPDEGDHQGEPRTFNCDGLTGSGAILFNLGQVRPGMSGSPLLNQATGKVCGMVKFTRDRSIDLGGGAICTGVILEQFPQLRELQQEFHQRDRRWSEELAALTVDWDDLLARIEADEVTNADRRRLRELLTNRSAQLLQLGKYNINIGQGQDIQIGDRTYVEINEAAIEAIVAAIQQQGATTLGIPSNLPRSGVVEFVGRAEAMGQLHELLQQSDSLRDGKAKRVAISAIAGMGGIGKTELALQYALTYQQTYQGGLCWLQARSGDLGTQLLRFAQSCLAITPPDGLELADQVKYCWRNWQAGEVLLVFDDVIDYGVIEPYFPPSTEDRFKVLITTRLQLGRSVQQLQLDVLDEAAALTLLESLVEDDRIQAQLDEAKQLCEQLGYLPLGLELAGRYLDRKADLSVRELQQRLEKGHLAAKALCQTDADMTAKLGVAAAFQLSWDTLSREAQQLGCGLSLFAAAPIPWSIVEQEFAEHDLEELEEWRDNELLNLYLLQRVEASTYRLHPLIREFFQSQLEQFPQVNEIKQQFCRTLASAAKQIPERPTREEILSIAPLMPHLVRVATAMPDWLEQEDLIYPYVGLGRFYEGQGLYAEAEPWYSECLSLSRAKLGEDHPDVAQSLNNLAGLYDNQGRYSDAEPLYLQALELRRRILGEEYPDVATILNNLALLYLNQGRYSEAEPLLQQALELLGEDYPDVATILNNLALLYLNQGRYSEAEPLFQQALALFRRLLGEDHPDVAQSLNNLAGLYKNQGRYSDAEPLYLQALELRRRILGEDHPDVAQSLNNLAGLYDNQGRYSDAEPLLQQALELRRRLLGEDHPDVAQSLNNLAGLYRNQGRYTEAEPHLVQAVELFKRLLGEKHPNVGRCLTGLGKLQAAQGRQQAAEATYLAALEILEQGLGTDHPWTVHCRENLEQLHNRSG